MGFFGGGASVDLASPSAIGSTTPNTGAFTTLSFAPANNTTGFSNTSNSLTGSNAQSLINLAQTWNTTGTPTAINLNITNTASNSSSKFIDFQIGGMSQCFVGYNGANPVFNIKSTTATVYSIAGNGASLLFYYGASISNSIVFTFGVPGIVMPSTGSYGFGASTDVSSGAGDLYLVRDAANILAQRRTTNAQTFRIYNTFTDASNYERGFMRWATNVLEIGAEAAGTGTQRQLRFPLGTVTASTPLSITQTWNSAGVTFTGIQANITDTASASASLLMDLQVGGSTRFKADKNGYISVGVNPPTNYTSLISGTIPALTIGFNIRQGAATAYSFFDMYDYLGNAVFRLNESAQLGIGRIAGSGIDVWLQSDAAQILAQRNSTNAQAFKLYRTFTNSSNYERLGILATNTTRYTITSENSGTGSARSLEVSFYTAASDPTSTDITSGCFSVWKNSGTGTIKLWANDGGTMKSVALA